MIGLLILVAAWASCFMVFRSVSANQREQAEITEEEKVNCVKRNLTEEQIDKLAFLVKQSEADVRFLREQIAELDAMLDNLMVVQSSTTPQSVEYGKYQSKIIALRGKIHAAEKKLNKALYEKSVAEGKLSA